MKDEPENWGENLAEGRRKMEEYLGKFPQLWLLAKKGWRNLEETGDDVSKLEASGKLADLDRAANKIRETQQQGLKVLTSTRETVDYQAAFESWLDVQRRSETKPDDKRKIADLLQLEGELREKHERLSLEFDRQRMEFGLLYQSLLQRTEAERAKIAARAERRLTVFGIVLTVIGVIIAILELLT